MLNLPPTTSRDDIVLFRGGLDLLTPTLQLKPGYVRDALNFEASVSGGYTRIPGYERFDGRTNPSDAVYLTVTLNVTGALAVGNVMTGASSAATGTVIYIAAITGGTLVAYTRSSGSFTSGETINVAGTPRATVIDLGGAEDAADFDVRMRYLAAENYRASILAVPGSGPIRGVVFFKDTLYAFRDNAGGTACAIYKSTSTGWQAVALQYTVSFNTGSVAPVEGNTVTQGANSATVRRVVLESGTWGGGNAAGRLIITQPAPGAFAAGALTGGGTLTLTGASAAQSALLPGGTYEFDIGTVDDKQRVYGCDGVNKGFEFDGTTFVPITTGNTPDQPNRVMVHSGHLFFAFKNSLQNSGIGLPFNWNVIAGAGERQADGDITAMGRLPGSQQTGAAAIGHEQGLQILYGTSNADFQLVSFEDSSGAKPRSMQRLGQMYVLDDRGVLSLAASQNYGNFSSATLTLGIRPYVQVRRNLITGSTINREKNQFRMFFSDGSALYMTIANGKLLGSMPMQFPDVVRCACSGETPDGTETSFFGSDDGWVYRLDAGTSFDGDAIDFYLTLAPANQGSPRQIKRYRKATFEVQGDSYATFGVAFDFAYSSTERSQQEAYTVAELALRAARWDEFTWDAFVWDGNNLAPSEIPIDGSGENIATRISGSSAMFQPFTINSEIITYSPRRRMR